MTARNSASRWQAFSHWPSSGKRHKALICGFGSLAPAAAVNFVLRDKKCSTSYIQRRLSVGYNKAASLVERMEQEGVVGSPNHSGKRAILVGGGIDRGAFDVAAGG
jgi:Ftsk gamma domain